MDLIFWQLKDSGHYKLHKTVLEQQYTGYFIYIYFWPTNENIETGNKDPIFCTVKVIMLAAGRVAVPQHHGRGGRGWAGGPPPRPPPLPELARPQQRRPPPVQTHPRPRGPAGNNGQILLLIISKHVRVLSPFSIIPILG